MNLTVTNSLPFSESMFQKVQCPNSGGRGVLIARFLKQALGDTLVYNDSLLCAGLGGSPRLSNKKKENTNLFLFVYPNPSNEICTFNYKLPEDVPGTIEFYNLLGKKIEKVDVKPNSRSMVFKTDHLVDGIYLIRLKAAEYLCGMTKMTIIR